MTNLLKCLCSSTDFKEVHQYTAPPKKEVKFEFSSSGNYKRSLFQCQKCQHFISVHSMNISSLYNEDYVSSNYKDLNGIYKTFNQINSLPADKSDNIGRVKRILDFAQTHFGQKTLKKRPSVMDIGSGLCVFLYRMKEAGWNGTALDPDVRSARHAEENVGVKAICSSFMEYDGDEIYDVVTFNKVLEHVKDPVPMLAKSKTLLNPHGFVYIELPDGEEAFAKEGPQREEFTIDHIHIFSKASTAILAKKAGFRTQLVERLQEPSSKYTLRTFITPL